MNTESRNRFAGFTMIELLIAMAVTLIILGVAVNTFRDALQSNNAVTQSSDMTDNLRAGLNLLELDLQQAGEGIPQSGIPIPYTSNGSSTAPCGTTAAPNRPVLTGTATFPQCNAVLPAVEPGQAMGPLITAPDAIAGNPSNPNSFTDEITVLYADNTAVLDGQPVNKPATTTPVASPACNGTLTVTGNSLTVVFDATCINLATVGTPVQAGDLVMFTNTKGSTILTVTSVSGQALTFAAGDVFNLNGRTDPSGTIKQLETSSTCGGAPSCFPPTTATRIMMISYYLDNITSPPYIRLIRRINFNTPTPVGETLENLQFTYNFVDGATNPSNQAGVPSGNSESQIRSVNVFLGARSSYNQRQGARLQYARNNLTTQISLRSMSYVNKYQ
jgi:prepilin-type N-terminal cleavage/methylation domain-containing protein